MFKDPTQEEAFNSYNALPQHLRNALFAEENVDFVFGICEKNNLSEDQTKAVAKLAGDVILGFVPIGELSNAIQEKTGIAPENAKIIGYEIKSQVLDPISDELARLYNYEKERTPETPKTEDTPPTEVPQPIENNPTPQTPPPSPLPQPTETLPQPTPPQTPPQPPQAPAPQKPQAPVPTPPQTPTPPPPPPPAPQTPPPPTPPQPKPQQAPFMIHEEKEGLSPVGSGGNSPELVRPFFYDSSSGVERAEKNAPQTPARLELGDNTPEEVEAPQIGQIKAPDIKTVNYSGPKTEVDPFSKEAYEKETPGNPSSSNIPTGNVVDLKKNLE